MEDKTLCIIRHVHEDVFVAASYFNMYRQLHDYFAEHAAQANAVGSFTLQAYLDSMIMRLARVLERDKDAVNLECLLNAAQRGHQSFAYAESCQVLNMVSNHRDRLAQLREQYVAIRNARDKDIAHFDRIHFNDPDRLKAEFPFTIEVREVEQLIRELWCIIDAYERFHTNGTHLFDPIGWRDPALVGDVRH